MRINNYIFFLFFVCFISSCYPKPKIPISNTLEIALDKHYSHYVRLLNGAMDSDSVALSNFLKINNIYDAAGYDHGWILIKIMKEVGDEKFSTILASLNTDQISNVKDYFRVGMMGEGNSNDTIATHFSKTFHYLRFSDSEIKILKYY